MKKTYSKPGIIIEEFCMAESIASCGAKPGGVDSTTGKPAHADKSSCGWYLGNLVIWVEGAAGCINAYPDIPVDGMCYHNPNSGNTIFSSF